MIRLATWACGLMLVTAAGLPVAASAADELGRLFTTPGERAQLDEARRAAPLEPLPVIVPQAQGTKPVEVEGALTLRGLVKRGAGRSTAWVNDSNTYEGDLDSPYRTVDKSGIAADQVSLKLPDGRASVQVKVGQTYETASSRIRELGTAPDPAVPGAAAPPPEEEDDE